MKILIADKLATEGPQYLEAQPNVEVTVQTGLDDARLVAALRTHDGVVVRSSVQITAPVLEQAMDDGVARLRGIARAGVGVDNIDLNAATRYGIAVMNSASASTITTAEHAFALMIALARNIGPAHKTMCEGGWDRSKYVGAQLHGRTLGVVGFGRIGRTMADRALAFGMRVLAYDPFMSAESEPGGTVELLPTFDDLIRQVDIVSFHVPKTDTTAGMLGAEQFAIAKPHLLVVNAARGGIVDESALLHALDHNQCAGAAIDVYPSEPPAADDPLRTHPNILCTPHLGASTAEAQEAVAVDACKALLTFLRGEGLDGAVNAGRLDLQLSDRQRLFADLTGRMTALLHAAAAAPGVDALDVTIRGETLAQKAETITRHALTHVLKKHLEQPISVINAAMIAEQRGIEITTTIAADHGDDRITIALAHGESTHVVEGAIFQDGQPRVTSLDGYAMNIVPEGHLILITNADEPGRVGLVGQVFGDSGVNIADMIIGRKYDDKAKKRAAMMILKLDAAPTPAILDALRGTPGILTVASVNLE